MAPVLVERLVAIVEHRATCGGHGLDVAVGFPVDQPVPSCPNANRLLPDFGSCNFHERPGLGMPSPSDLDPERITTNHLWKSLGRRRAPGRRLTITSPGIEDTLGNGSLPTVG